MSPTRVLVIQNDERNDQRRLGDWLIEAGANLHLVRAFAGEKLPKNLDGYHAMVVLGGHQNAFEAPDGTPCAPWFPELKQLIRLAIRLELPYLGVCLGSQLLAEACGGRVGRSPNGAEVGVKLIAKRDAAAIDPLFAAVPLMADTLQWHQDEVLELPPGAIHLAAGAHSTVQAFRVVPHAWGVQFHPECDEAMIREKTSARVDRLRSLGVEPDDLVTDVVAHLDDIAEAWRPFTHRFVALAREWAVAKVGAAVKPKQVREPARAGASVRTLLPVLEG